MGYHEKKPLKIQLITSSEKNIPLAFFIIPALNCKEKRDLPRSVTCGEHLEETIEKFNAYPLKNEY